MKNISGIVFLSFPFAAGTAAAALIAEPFAGALGSSLGAVALLCFCAVSGRRDKGLLMAAFFFLGCLCWNSHALMPPPPRPEKSHAVLELARLIDRTPFTGENSRAIIKALLTGIRDELPRDTVRVFRESGASHILALSGLHLGIIYLCLKRLLLPLGNSVPARTAGSAAVIILCGLYALGTGASPSIVRAFLFILIGETGRALSGRRHSPAGTLCTALTLQLCFSPLLISSPGFQLSYLAMLGITLLYPRLEAWYPEGGGPLRRVWKAAALTISCQLFTAPAAWYHFRSLPLYFLITNLLSLPLAELVIVSAIASLVLEAAGAQPQLLPRACGTLVRVLEFCLETISSI